MARVLAIVCTAAQAEECARSVLYRGTGRREWQISVVPRHRLARDSSTVCLSLFTSIVTKVHHLVWLLIPHTWLEFLCWGPSVERRLFPPLVVSGTCASTHMFLTNHRSVCHSTNKYASRLHFSRTLLYFRLGWPATNSIFIFHNRPAQTLNIRTRCDAWWQTCIFIVDNH